MGQLMFKDSTHKKSLYETLEIKSNASLEEIKESYARAKSTYSEENPALYGIVSGSDRENTLQSIEEAFKVLSNPELKQEYDFKMGFNKNMKNQSFKIVEDQEDEFKLNRESQKVIHEDNFEKQSIKKLIETNKYQLSFESNPELEKRIREATEYNGEFLKEIREYKNVTIEKMADMTRISKTNLRNLESQDVENLPAMVYIRGFVYQYAKCLKLNPELVASSYVHQIKKKK